jgi:very-short-patch-repair endonuclease
MRSGDLREPSKPSGTARRGAEAAPHTPPPPLAGEGREGAGRGPTWRVNPKQRQRARTLRRDLTKAERIVWYGLRAHRLDGAGFRRQTPIGPYIVDFMSHAAKLIIEIDGGQHFDDAGEAGDKRRDVFLASKGFRVLRFSNHDVMTNRMGVLETIAAAVRDARAPSLPSPASGGGGARGTGSVQSQPSARGEP